MGLRAESADRSGPGRSWLSVPWSLSHLSAMLPWWSPLVVWLLFVVVMAATLTGAVDNSRSLERQVFAQHVGSGAVLVAQHLDHEQESATERATELLSDPVIPSATVALVVRGLGFSAGAVFDDKGIYLSGLGMVENPEFVGQDFTERLDHLRSALLLNAPAVSQATISPALDTPVVGLAVPYPTPFGQRVLTGAIALQGGTFTTLMQRAAQASWDEVEGVQYVLVDREAVVIAASDAALSGELVPLSQIRPDLAVALRGSSGGEFASEGVGPVVFDAAAVGDTGWRLVASAPAASVHAAMGGLTQIVRWTAMIVAGPGLMAALLLTWSTRRRREAEQETSRLNTGLTHQVGVRTSELRVANRDLEAALGIARDAERAALPLAAIVEAAGEAILGLATDGVISAWNPAARNLYGYTPQEAIGKHLSMLIAADDVADCDELLARVRDGERITGHVATRYRKDGKPRVVAISMAPIVGADGTVAGIASIHADLTDQREVEERERHAQAMFASVFRSGGAAQAISDMSGRFLLVNDAWCDLLGHTRAELLTMTVDELTAPQNRPMTRRYFEQMREGTRDHIQVTKRYLHRDGQAIVALASLSVVRDGDGAPTHMVAMLQDVSDQTEATERLAQREALLSGVTSSSANITAMYDAHGRCVFAAGAGLAVIGLTPDDVIGSFYHGNVAAEPDAVEAFQRSLTGEPADFTIELAGHVYDVRLRGVSSDGSVTHVAAAVTDITQQQHATAVLERSERRFRALVRHASDAIMQVDASGIVVYVSPGIEGIVGLPADDVVGRDVLDLVVVGDVGIATADLVAATVPGASVAGSVRLLHTAGDGRLVAYRIRNLLDDPAVGTLVVTVRDPTDREQSENERRGHALELEVVNAQLELVNADLRAAVVVRDHILDATTHELRTPLTPLVGMLEVLRLRWDELSKDQLRTHFELLERNGTRLAVLVEDLLFASRLRTGDLRPSSASLSVRPFVRRALSLWPGTMDSLVTGEDAVVCCDAEHFDQILTSLVSNVVKYGLPPYEVEVIEDEGSVEIRVHDRGPGIAEGDAEQIFAPFVQASRGDRRTASGLGLGLPMARALALANGGVLDHANRQGGGSTFTVTLPAGVSSSNVALDSTVSVVGADPTDTGHDGHG